MTCTNQAIRYRIATVGTDHCQFRIVDRRPVAGHSADIVESSHRTTHKGDHRSADRLRFGRQSVFAARQ